MLNLARFDVLSFDCYGTLIDWEGGILSALRPVLRRHGVDVSDAALLELYADAESGTESEAMLGEHVPYRIVLQRSFDAVAESLGIRPLPEERNCLLESLPAWKPFPDTVAALKKLSKRFRLAIISNIDDALFAETRKLLEVDFDPIITAEEARAYKPSARIFELACERIGVPRDRVLHVAQSLYHDIAPISAMGISTVHVDRRADKRRGKANPVAEARATLVVPDLCSLASLADGPA